MTMLSIIIPVRNRHAALSELLGQLRAQGENTPNLLEVIVVDDGSQPAIVLPQSAVLRLVRHDKPRGAQAARRYGLSMAKGELIHFHDSDDLMSDGWVAQVLDAFASDWRLGVLITARTREVLGAPPVLVKPEIAVQLAREPRWFCHYQRYRNAIGPIGGVTMRRSCVSEEDLVEAPASQDWLLYDAVLARHPKVAVRHDITFTYRSLDDLRISASPRRRVKGYLTAARQRFNARWAARVAAIIYCAHAGDALTHVVRVRHRAFWSFLGTRMAESRALAALLQRAV